MDNGGRFIISSIPRSTLPDNNLNYRVQECGLGKSSTLHHTSKEMRLLRQLKTKKDSVEDLIQKAMHLSESIESLSTPLNCLIMNQRPIMSLESQLSK